MVSSTSRRDRFVIAEPVVLRPLRYLKSRVEGSREPVTHAEAAGEANHAPTVGNEQLLTDIAYRNDLAARRRVREPRVGKEHGPGNRRVEAHNRCQLTFPVRVRLAHRIVGGVRGPLSQRVLLDASAY